MSDTLIQSSRGSQTSFFHAHLTSLPLFSLRAFFLSSSCYLQLCPFVFHLVLSFSRLLVSSSILTCSLYPFLVSFSTLLPCPLSNRCLLASSALIIDRPNFLQFHLNDFLLLTAVNGWWLFWGRKWGVCVRVWARNLYSLTDTENPALSVNTVVVVISRLVLLQIITWYFHLPSAS